MIPAALIVAGAILWLAAMTCEPPDTRIRKASLADDDLSSMLLAFAAWALAALILAWGAAT